MTAMKPSSGLFSLVRLTQDVILSILDLSPRKDGPPMNQSGTHPLETSRLILRKFTLEDAQDMYNNWASDAEVTRFLTWPAHTGPEVSRKVLMDWISHYDEPDFYNWAIVWKKTGRVIGNISVVKQTRDGSDSADIGFCMSRPLWGQGIMPEALKSVIRFLFDHEGFRRVAACHDIRNPRSGRVMERPVCGKRGSGETRQRTTPGSMIWSGMHFFATRTIL